MAHKVNEVRERDCHADIPEWCRDHGDREECSRENHVAEEDKVRNCSVGFDAHRQASEEQTESYQTHLVKSESQQEETWVKEGDDATTDQVEEKSCVADYHCIRYEDARPPAHNQCHSTCWGKEELLQGAGHLLVSDSLTHTPNRRAEENYEDEPEEEETEPSLMRVY